MGTKKTFYAIIKSVFYDSTKIETIKAEDEEKAWQKFEEEYEDSPYLSIIMLTSKAFEKLKQEIVKPKTSRTF